MNGGILVLAEHLKGEAADITFEMLGIGRKTADALGTSLTAVVIGANCASVAGKLGTADKVLVIENPQWEMPDPQTVAAQIQNLIAQKNFDLIFIGGTNVSMGVGSVLAKNTGRPFVNFCRDLRVDGGTIVVTSQLFGGKIFSDVPLSGNTGIVSIYPGCFPADAGKSDRATAVESISAVPVDTKVVFKRYIEPEAGDVDITKVDFLVAVGRGMQNADNLGLAEDVAKALGGAVCASRPVVDQGWLPMTRQVGKSGMIVKPRLYLACGISGAPEHEEGMKGSRLIIAINTDTNAPIFNVAQYGVNADALDVLPALAEEIKKRK